jgi:hypothetical protein
MTFHNLDLGEATGVASLNNKRVILQGISSISVAKSEKFGLELCFQVYGKKYRMETRNPSDWNRVEIFVPIKDLNALFEKITNFLRSKDVQSFSS